MVSRCGRNDLAYRDRIEAATGQLTLRRLGFAGASLGLRWGQAWFSVFRPIVRSKVVTVRW